MWGQSCGISRVGSAGVSGRDGSVGSGQPETGYRPARTLPQVTDPAAVVALPRSARLACWLRALVDGRASLDDALAAVVGDDTAHDVVGLGGTADAEPMALALGRLRGLRPSWVQMALPVPGEPIGLAGPPEFNVDALDAGECVVLGGTGLGLVPHVAGAGVVWRAHAADDPPPYDVDEAYRALRRSVSVSADALAELDLARWNPDAADTLLNLRAPADLALPSGTSGEAAGVLATALRCHAIVGAALDSDSAAMTAAEHDRRSAALAPLARASRLAVSATCSTVRRR